MRRAIDQHADRWTLSDTTRADEMLTFFFNRDSAREKTTSLIGPCGALKRQDEPTGKGTHSGVNSLPWHLFAVSTVTGLPHTSPGNLPPFISREDHCIVLEAQSVTSRRSFDDTWLIWSIEGRPVKRWSRKRRKKKSVCGGTRVGGKPSKYAND